MAASGKFIEGGTPQYAAISCSSSGDNQIVAAITGQVIRMIRFTVISASAVNGKFRSANTDLTAAMPLANGLSGNEAPMGHFETAAGEAMNLNLSSGVAVVGYMTYVAYTP